MTAARIRLRVKYWHAVVTGWKADELAAGLLWDGEAVRVTTNAVTNAVVRIQIVAAPTGRAVGFAAPSPGEAA